MVLHTCERMAAGGIHDQLGGGFARYSVDAEWLVPHFEKMLYDNAQLVQLYLDAFLVSGDSRHCRNRARHSGLRFARHDASRRRILFRRGCRQRRQGGKVLLLDARRTFQIVDSRKNSTSPRNYFGITAEGNFVDHSHPDPLAGQNVLSIVDPERSAGDETLLASPKTKCSPSAPNASVRIWTTKFWLRGTA